MEPFLRRFFPQVLRRMAAAKGNEYCLYDSQTLTAFTSSLYVAGLVASLVASRVTAAMGRQAVMLMGGALFFAGGAMTGAAVNIAMLIVGRMLLGFGVGFTNQVSSRPPLHSCISSFRSSAAHFSSPPCVTRAPANGPKSCADDANLAVFHWTRWTLQSQQTFARLVPDSEVTSFSHQEQVVKNLEDIVRSHSLIRAFLLKQARVNNRDCLVEYFKLVMQACGLERSTGRNKQKEGRKKSRPCPPRSLNLC
jgi:hypothetical protein